LLLLNAFAFWALTASLRVFFLANFALTGSATSGAAVGLTDAFAPAAYSLEDVPAEVAAFLGGDAGLLVAACVFFGDEGLAAWFFLGDAGFF